MEPETEGGSLEAPAAKATGPGSKKVNGCTSALTKLQERRAKLEAKLEALEAKAKAKPLSARRRRRSWPRRPLPRQTCIP